MINKLIKNNFFFLNCIKHSVHLDLFIKSYDDVCC
ncbi:hypothetical protein AZ038_001581 [Enterobacter hormaechei]|nr:hypothetical protein AZ038_001581 [Enterobacter hormaechei]